LDHQHIRDEAMFPALLAQFYARVREDALLGPVFGRAVQDWDEHLERIGRFWSSVMFGTGRYKGDPVARHLAITPQITPEMFGRWLALWAETTDAMLDEGQARALQAKAARIAESLQLALRFPSPAQKAMGEGPVSPPEPG
jgi:hemoglobin